MYTEYAEELSETALFDEQVERPSNLPLPVEFNYLLFTAWGVLCLVGFAVIFSFKMVVIGMVIIGVPTFLLMIIKPTFALCIMMAVLPTGSGVGAMGRFSLDRGIAIAVTLSFLLNIMISRPTLHVRNKALWFMVAYTIWATLISTTSPQLKFEMINAFIYVQLTAFTFIVYWILETNGEPAFRWVLRSYIVGTLSIIAMTYVTGTAMRIMEEQKTGRYGATLGKGIDSNMLAVMIGLAFLAAVYLIISDRNIFFRIIYCIALIFLPVMMIRVASRGGLIAMFVTLTSPLLFLKQVLKKPSLAAALLLTIIIGSGAIWVLTTRDTLGTQAAARLTRFERIQESFNYRLGLISEAVKTVSTKPLGITHFGWLESHYSVPHNDFFYNLAIYGVPGAAFFAGFVIVLVLTVKRIPLGYEKFYSRAIVTFLLVAGLGLGQISQKHYWIFMIIAMACERIAQLKSQESEYIETQIDEETANINY